MKSTLVTVYFEVEEIATCAVEAEVEVPADIADDDDALQAWLEDNERSWVDQIDPMSQEVSERTVLDVYGTDV
ncbi:hypothetical protein [Streptomyces luteireticuli]|uniref:hypothetical protein n=1 Tax=Streptomyces luteireticuli TaxID=173858 RepID=UPI00355925A4